MLLMPVFSGAASLPREIGDRTSESCRARALTHVGAPKPGSAVDRSFGCERKKKKKKTTTSNLLRVPLTDHLPGDDDENQAHRGRVRAQSLAETDLPDRRYHWRA